MDAKERNLIAKVSKLYYLEGWTQNEICKKVGLSRPIISKILQQAREKNIVEVYMKDETVHTVELERKLEKKYGLHEAVVVSVSNKGPEMVRRRLGQAATAYLSKKINQLNTIGVSWGKSVSTFVEEFQSQQQSHIHLVPLIGGMGQGFVQYHSNHLSFQLAQQLNTSSSYLYAPAVAETADLKHAIKNSKDVAAVLEEGRKVDIAIVGVSSPSCESTMVGMGYLNEQDVRTLKDSGAVGDINSCFYNRDGQLVQHPINDRVIGLDLEEIKEIPEVLAIAEGAYKAEGLHVALKSKYLDVLVTDDKTAESLLEYD
ncbi:DNA-binding transcriptional regulator LsrR, DeoR family [Virgibacillus subterraneus]|uniref:DNA-binding transcriptional regulator LsrR, DeoR family n=1 Tax=Virgibacillus subterraneus TaxID=621109 RepID=A0A1H9ALS0_9BACI|nr:sugar-binding transcriptional regulator [Virgibacillus subterraneus]SEP77752.1 DNA-binding transcriptional regulator LsrR, DeoR family [Virgibacillus subterraneus]